MPLHAGAVVSGLAGARGLPRRPRMCWVCGRGDSGFPRSWGPIFPVCWRYLGGVCSGVMHAWCLGLMGVQRPGGRVAVCGSRRREVLFAARLVVLACVGGLALLACAFDFGGFLL